VIQTGDTALEKAIAMTTPTAASDRTAETAATINSGRRKRNKVMHLTLTVPPVRRAPNGQSVPGRITLEDQTNTVLAVIP
jgi:hypothetical protein